MSKRERRIHELPIVRTLAALFNEGYRTRFQHEGPARALLRSGRCLEGDPWPDADEFARRVVLCALARVGAIRPSWKEAQPPDPDGRSHTFSRRNCAGCGAELEDENRTTWCSRECAVNARQRERNRQHAVDRAAARAALKPGTTRCCEQCRVMFFEVEADSPLQKYCSRECSIAAIKQRALDPIPCRNCGQEFRPDRGGRKFCSMECRDEFNRPDIVRGACACCEKPFTFRNAREMSTRRFCSRACAYRNYERSGRFVAE